MPQQYSNELLQNTSGIISYKNLRICTSYVKESNYATKVLMHWMEYMNGITRYSNLLIWLRYSTLLQLELLQYSIIEWVPLTCFTLFPAPLLAKSLPLVFFVTCSYWYPLRLLHKGGCFCVMSAYCRRCTTRDVAV